jgi:hypothetical protein
MLFMLKMCYIWADFIDHLYTFHEFKGEFVLPVKLYYPPHLFYL